MKRHRIKRINNDDNHTLEWNGVIEVDGLKNWGFEEDFISWVENENVFCNTLVDRINTGYPKDENIESDDKMLNTSEYFHLWVVEGYDKLFDEIPFDKAGLNVIVTNELEKYRTRRCVF